MATVVKDLGAVTAYAYAVEQGYTGTEEEFAQLMASYADVAEAAAASAQAAAASEAAASVSEQAAAASETAAAGSASSASADAATAASAASTATQQAGIATSGAGTATQKAADAAASAQAAASSETAAAGSAAAAAASETNAGAAETAAQTAQAAAEAAAQSVGESAAQIEVNKEDIADLKSAINEIAYFSPNLLDKENIIRGKYLTSNNVEVTDANAFISNYFPCKPNEYFITKYSPYLGYGFITVYDSNKQYIGNINGWKTGNYSCYQAGSASNIAFARICHQINMLDELMVVSGQEYPTTYMDYDENKILEKTLPSKLWLKVTAYDIADAVFLNIFDKTTAVDGEYVESTTGAFSYSSTYWRSGFIPVKPNTVYRASANNRVAFYDTDKVYIVGYNSQYTYTSPSNAAYIVVCNTPLDSKNTFMLAENANFDSIYHAYGVKVPWLIDNAPKSKYEGKKLICFGDSITNYGYIDTIKSDTGIDAVNVGLSSGRYAYSDDSDQYVNAFAFHNIIYAISTGDWTIPDTLNGVSGYETQYAHIQDIKTINFNDVDFISIAYGTNDFSSATPLDDADYPLDPEKSFKGAIRYCLKLLTEKYPHLKIIGVTPCYRFWSENDTILYDSDEHAVGGLYLNQYVQAVEDVYTEYHLPVVNNYTNAGINKYNRLQYFSISDGLHPNANGRAVIGHRIGNGIIANY